VKIELIGLTLTLLHQVYCLGLEPDFVGSGFEWRFAIALDNDSAQLIQ
jgi:hypothetical protein